jgi:hypothetical protein
VLSETTTSSDDQRRRNYIYVHDSLYPVYMDVPSDLNKELRHQYVIFIRDENFESLLKLLNRLRESLGIVGNEVLIQPVPCKNDQMLTMLKNEGSIAGHDWANYNASRYIRVTLDRPVSKSGPIYRYHLAMANLLNAYYETLVGYKYRPGLYNEDPSDPVWQTWVVEDGRVKKIPIIQKHVSEPLGSIMTILESLV